MSNSKWTPPDDIGREVSKIFQEFPDVSGRQFEKKDFPLLVKVLSKVDTKWYYIGLALTIDDDSLSSIKDKWRRNAKRGLIEVLWEWMKGGYDDKRLYPCWCSVVYVVADEMVKYKAFAWEIAKHWREYEENPFWACEVQLSQAHLSTPLQALDLKKKRALAKELYINFLKYIKSHWYQSGVLLGLPIDELEMRDSTDDSIREVVLQWFDLHLNCEDFPEPTLAILVDVVAHPMGGANPNLASKLAGHVPKCLRVESDTATNQGLPSSADGSAAPNGSASLPLSGMVPQGATLSPGTTVPTFSPADTVPMSEVPMETASLPDLPVEFKKYRCYTVVCDGPGQYEEHEAYDRGTYRPNLKLDDSNKVLTPIIPDEFHQERPEKLKYYNMTALKHSIALVFSNQEFSSDRHRERIGTERDVANIVETCRFLGYRAVVCRNYCKDEILDIFKNLNKFLTESNDRAKEKVKIDSFMCFFLSHGKQGAIISSDSEEIELDEIDRLTGESELLNSKPKIFFVQTCRGRGGGTQPVERVVPDGNGTTSTRTDFYFCYATVSGERSYRDIYTGSWFITEVCKLLCKSATWQNLNSDFQLQLVKNVADMEPDKPGYRFYDKKQMKWFCQTPESTHRLTKHVHFFDSRKL